MKLKLALNIGKPDAQKLGLDFDKAKAGETINVKNDVGEVLLKNGWAIQTTADGTPVESQVATATETPDFDAMTLAELRDYASANNIDGVSNLNKDDTLKAVKKAAKAR